MGNANKQYRLPKLQARRSNKCPDLLAATQGHKVADPMWVFDMVSGYTRDGFCVGYGCCYVNTNC